VLQFTLLPLSLLLFAGALLTANLCLPLPHNYADLGLVMCVCVCVCVHHGYACRSYVDCCPEILYAPVPQGP